MAMHPVPGAAAVPEQVDTWSCGHRTVLTLAYVLKASMKPSETFLQLGSLKPLLTSLDASEAVFLPLFVAFATICPT
jgi:hypothetical protein